VGIFGKILVVSSPVGVPLEVDPRAEQNLNAIVLALLG